MTDQELDKLAAKSMKDFGFDKLDNLSRFEFFKLGINYGIKYQLERELANIKGEV